MRAIIPTYTKIPKVAAAKLRLPPFSSKVNEKGIALEAQLTKKFGIVDQAPSTKDLLR